MSKVTGVIALALILVLGGCTAPQTRELTSAWPEELEGQAELDFVPFFPQSRYQCGPAALATVLTVQGIDVTPEDLVGEVYVPERQGTLRTELISAARARGLIAYPIEPELSALFEALDARRPVLVMQNLGLDWVPQWHFAVAVGYDRASRELVLRSGTIARHVVSFSTFENTWERSDYWGIVVAEPRSPPVGVAPLNYLHAAHALEDRGHPAAARLAYQSASEAWPDSALAQLARGNALYADDVFDGAEFFYRLATTIEPESTSAWNNLAHSLLQQSCVETAQQALQCAQRLAPSSSALLQTQTEVDNSAREESGLCAPVMC